MSICRLLDLEALLSGYVSLEKKLPLACLLKMKKECHRANDTK
jgi:hypothetical protein